MYNFYPWILISSIIVFGLGVSVLIQTIIPFNKYSNRLFPSSNSFNILAIIQGVLFLPTGALLLQATLKRWRKFLINGWIALIILTISGFALGGSTFSMKNEQYDCENTEPMRRKNKFTNEIYKYFCYQRCPCDCKYSRSIPAELLPQMSCYGEPWRINAQACNDFLEDFRATQPDASDLASEMHNLEVSLHCTGFCKETRQYMFSDVNNLPRNASKNDCFSRALENNAKYFETIGAFLIAVSSLLGFHCLLFTQLIFNSKTYNDLKIN